MQKAPPFNPLRLVAPAQLAFCFILFFLPWVELLSLPSKSDQKLSKEEAEKVRKALGVDVTKPYTIISQSGLQVTINGASYSSDFKRLLDKLKQAGLGEFDLDAVEKERKAEMNGVPILFVYPLFLIGGIVVAFVVKPVLPRRLAQVGCCAGALFVVAIPAAVGFPVEGMKKGGEQFKGAPSGGGPGGGAGAKEKDKDKAKSENKEQTGDVRVSWQFPLYLTFLLLLGAAGTAFLDGNTGGGGKSRYGRKYGRHDEDDYDDEEDDRPRKRSRRDDYDDDEEDRPRKKKEAPLSLDDEDEPPPPPKKKRRDEDEDDRPRKKSRRDDYEEEDRPRKKKLAEPEFQMPAPLPPPPPPPAAPAGPNPFDFDAQEAPRKKPRQRDDEDDYEDRPRKKRRRDDDD